MRENYTEFLNFLEGKIDKESKALFLDKVKTDENFKQEFLAFKFTWDLTQAQKTEIAKTDDEWNKLSAIIEPKPLSIQNNILVVLLKYAAVFVVGFGIAFFVYHHQVKKVSTTANMFHEIVVPKGQKTQLILADGTKIWLNSDTKLKYSENFTENTRTVYLEGEAFFKVAKFRNLPFKVNVGKLEIQVMGTSFNIKGYPEDKEIETTLVEGKVQIKKIGLPEAPNNLLCLRPEQKAIYHKNDSSLVIAEVMKKEEKPLTSAAVSNNTVVSDITESVAPWKDQVLSFDNESLEEIATKLERWYGYKITIRDTEFLKFHYKGRFKNYETIYQVLDAIRLTTPIKYCVRGKEVIIEKKCNN